MERMGHDASQPATSAMRGMKPRSRRPARCVTRNLALNKGRSFNYSWWTFYLYTSTL
jgi:hypothetical protein